VPLVETFCCFGQVATPESESEQVNVTVTGVVFHIPDGLGETDALIVGGVLSKLTEAHACAESPTRSTAVPQIDCSRPSVETSTGCGQLARGDVPGTQLKLTVTSELFQPSTGVGVMTGTIVGGIGGSRSTVTVFVAEFPALSVAVTVKV
jgi:hypothetical protein